MQTHSQVVSEIMTQPALVIGPEWAASDVFDLAHRVQAHHFPVLEHGVLIGIVCTCDLRDAPAGKSVRSYARREVATIAPTRPVGEVARLMAARAVGSVVVVDADRICGIVTREDLQGARTRGENLLPEARCAACKGVAHLRAGPDGSFLCADCDERARGDNWFDTSAGD